MATCRNLTALWPALFCGLMAFLAAISPAHSQTASLPEWKKSLAELTTNSAKTRLEVLNLLADKAELKTAAEKKIPDYPATNVAQWVAERSLPEPSGKDEVPMGYWKLAYQHFSIAQQLLASPFASQKREGLEIINRLAISPFLAKQAPQLPGQIVDGFILPFLEAASSDDRQEISRPQLLQNAGSIYFNAKRRNDYQRTLRALIAVADPINREVSDLARFNLANELAKGKAWVEAVRLLEAITAPGLLEGSQKLAQDWKQQHKL